VKISPHLLQWVVIGFGLYVLVNFMQNMKVTDAQAHRVITGSPTLMMGMAVGALQSIINYGMMAFNPSFLIKQYHLTMGEAALQFGLLAAVSGIVGPLLWGPLSDWLNTRFPGSGRAYVAMFAMGVSPIMSFWVYHAPYALQSAWYIPDANSFYWRFIPYSFVLTGWLPPLYAIMYDQVLPRMRGITTSTYLLVMTIIGLGCGPYIVGMLSDALGDLRTAMLCINAAAIPIIVLMQVIARRAQRDEAGLLDRADHQGRSRRAFKTAANASGALDIAKWPQRISTQASRSLGCPRAASMEIIPSRADQMAVVCMGGLAARSTGSGGASTL
jgi:MFS transporter, Spinster family, sphingosine-1-phosphate transporter